MSEQTYASHARFVAPYHFVLSSLLLITLLGSLLRAYRAFQAGSGRLDALLLVIMTFIMMGLFWYCRIFPLKAQDRAIRAEESLRHYVLTGALFDPRLDTRQIIGLRFASDEELPALATRAAEEGLSEAQIKQSVQRWRPDLYRV